MLRDIKISLMPTSRSFFVSLNYIFNDRCKHILQSWVILQVAKWDQCQIFNSAYQFSSEYVKRKKKSHYTHIYTLKHLLYYVVCVTSVSRQDIRNKVSYLSRRILIRERKGFRKMWKRKKKKSLEYNLYILAFVLNTFIHLCVVGQGAPLQVVIGFIKRVVK